MTTETITFTELLIDACDASSHDDSVCIKRRKHYSIKFKLEVLKAIDTDSLSDRAASRKYGVPRRTLSDWVKEKENIFSFSGSEKTLARTTGKPEPIPFSQKPVAALNLADILFRKQKKREGTAYESLLRLMRRFASQRGFTRRTPHGLKEKRDDLLAVQQDFASKFKELYGKYDPSSVFNVDETSVYYDTPPSRILYERGQDASITAFEKHSARLTVACSVRGDKLKLPLLFIVCGQPGGLIKNNVLHEYPTGHFYTVQRKGWMDGRVWPKVLREVLPPFVEGPSVLLVDNLDCHVSQETDNTVTGELFSALQPLSKNSTSVCQPLDVGVMGPLIARLRAAWLLEDNDAKTIKEKRIATIKRVIRVWEDISSDTVQKSFNKALAVNF